MAEAVSHYPCDNKKAFGAALFSNRRSFCINLWRISPLPPDPPDHRIAVMLELYFADSPQSDRPFTAVVFTQPFVYCAVVAGLSGAVVIMTCDHNLVCKGEHLAVHAGDAALKVFQRITVPFRQPLGKD